MSGTLAFTPASARAFVHLVNGLPDYSQMLVGFFNPDYPCQNPSTQPAANTQVLVLQGQNTGGVAKGAFTPNFNLSGNSYAFLGYSSAMPDIMAGTFDFDWVGVDPVGGVNGRFNLASMDGGTANGSFSAQYCGAYVF